ncbi:MAG: glycosyltransferase [Alphaproteobacteria bacterium]|nr:glycosyltransferase [Alphaproteobacteria bacterium]
MPPETTGQKSGEDTPNKDALVTIAIPAYNSEKYLAPALQSCLDQTWPNIEVVISDDQSKDRTVEIIKAFMAKSDKISYITQEKNLGISANVNAAVRMGKGEFAIILDHDDILPPHHVERMLKHFTSKDIALVHCNAMRIDGDGNEIKMVGNDAEKIRQTKEPLKALCFNNFIQSCGMMFRRGAFDAIGGWDPSFHLDGEWDSYIRYAEKFKFGYAADTFGYYRVHETNITRALQKKEKIFDLDDNRARCRARAMQSANLNPFDAALVHLKVWRKNLRRWMRHGRRPPRNMKPEDYKRVLVVKLGAFGDFINAFAVFAAIRKHHPQAEITLLTTAPFAGFAEKSGWFDKVWQVRRWLWNEPAAWRGFAREMGVRDFELVYDIQRNDRMKILRLLSPARAASAWVGGGKRKDPYVLKTSLPPGALDTTDTDAFPVPETPWLDADISKYNLKTPFVLLVPGAAPQHPGKRWPVAHYAALAGRLARSGFTPVVLGAGAETERAAELQKLEPAVVNLCGQTDFFELAALARKAAGAIGNDTGPMHLTAAVGCPTLVLFSGFSDPDVSAPRGGSVATLRGIPIENLSPDAVWNKFQSFTKQKQAV